MLLLHNLLPALSYYPNTLPIITNKKRVTWLINIVLHDLHTNKKRLSYDGTKSAAEQKNGQIETDSIDMR
jgi:hypothetical protein